MCACVRRCRSCARVWTAWRVRAHTARRGHGEAVRAWATAGLWARARRRVGGQGQGTERMGTSKARQRVRGTRQGSSTRLNASAFAHVVLSGKPPGHPCVSHRNVARCAWRAEPRRGQGCGARATLGPGTGLARLRSHAQAPCVPGPRMSVRSQDGTAVRTESDRGLRGLESGATTGPYRKTHKGGVQGSTTTGSSVHRPATPGGVGEWWRPTVRLDGEGLDAAAIQSSGEPVMRSADPQRWSRQTGRWLDGVPGGGDPSPPRSAPPPLLPLAPFFLPLLRLSPSLLEAAADGKRARGPRVCTEADWCLKGGRSGLAWSSRWHGRRGSPRGWRFTDGATWLASRASPIWARGRGRQGGQARASARAGEPPLSRCGKRRGRAAGGVVRAEEKNRGGGKGD